MPKYITIQGNFNINDKVITTKFGYIKNPKNTSCPISCDDFKPEDNVIKINKCGHIVSKAELKDWFMINKSCPLCNYNIEYDNYDEPIRCFKTAPYNIENIINVNTIEELYNITLQELYTPHKSFIHYSSSETPAEIIDIFNILQSKNNKKSRFELDSNNNIILYNPVYYFEFIKCNYSISYIKQLIYDINCLKYKKRIYNYKPKKFINSDNRFHKLNKKDNYKFKNMNKRPINKKIR
jgi:hypothetical protein